MGHLGVRWDEAHRECAHSTALLLGATKNLNRGKRPGCFHDALEAELARSGGVEYGLWAALSLTLFELMRPQTQAVLEQFHELDFGKANWS